MMCRSSSCLADKALLGSTRCEPLYLCWAGRGRGSARSRPASAEVRPMDAAPPAAPALASQVSASPESARRGVPGRRSALLIGRGALLPRSCPRLAQRSPARLPVPRSARAEGGRGEEALPRFWRRTCGERPPGREVSYVRDGGERVRGARRGSALRRG